MYVIFFPKKKTPYHLDMSLLVTPFIYSNLLYITALGFPFLIFAAAAADDFSSFFFLFLSKAFKIYIITRHSLLHISIGSFPQIFLELVMFFY